MNFLRYLVHIALSPYLHFALLLIALLILIVLKKHKWSRIFAYILSAWLFLFIFLPIPDYWVQHFESQFEPLKLSSLDTSKNYTIVILGAGTISDPDLPPLQDLQETMLARLSEGVRIYHALPSACLVTSGGSFESGTPQAQVVAEAALSLDIAPFDTLRMDHTLNTESEAKTAAQFLKSESPVILVTSAIHMPRAVYWFEQYGVEVIPAPTDYLIKDDPEDVDFFWEGWTNRMEYMQKVIHETVGLIYAKWESGDGTREVGIIGRQCNKECKD